MLRIFRCSSGVILTMVACMWIGATPAHAVQMGIPGFAGEDGDFVASAAVGYRDIVLLDNPAAGQYDRVRAFELTGKVGYQATSWLLPEIMVGGTTHARTQTSFKGFFSPTFGAALRFVPVNDHEGFSFSIDLATMYARIKGTLPDPVLNTRDALTHKSDSVAGATFIYCLERSCVYLGGRYTMYGLWEDGVRHLAHRGGVYGGVDYYVTPNVYFGLEAQNFDGDAVYLGVGGRF